MIPTAGEHFGPYEILGTLGRGGVGEVYRAWDARLEREVALKLLHDDDYPQHGNRERFMIEARAASALNHANICTVFDIGQKDGAPYLVMELLKGETLKYRIERGGISSEDLAQFGVEIAEALGAAHALGIVHRDIKPANVMLVRQPDGRSRVKVLDFGLAKLTGPLPGRLVHHDEHLTVAGEAVGTVSYMSPEQARGEELDGRSDLFSLGVVLYEMATRRTPFHGSTTALLFVQLLNHQPEPIQEWNESVPRALEKAIFKLLEKDPSRRFQTASEAANALQHAIHKTATSRWRRASAPPVPLVRVEEPIARAGLPPRPDFRHEHGVVSLGLGSSHENTPAHLAQDTPPGRLHADPPLPAIDRPRPSRTSPSRTSPSRTPSPQRISTHVSVYQSAPPPAHTSGLHLALRETPVGSLTAAVDELEARPAPVPEDQPEPVREAAPEPVHDQTPPAKYPSWNGGFLHVAVAEPATNEADAARKRNLIRGAIAAGVLATVGAAFALTRIARGPAALLSPADPILITEIENHTGVQTLDGGLAAGFGFALAESPELDIRGIGAYRAAVHAMGADARPASPMQARQAAHATGAKAYLYGEIREAEEGAHSTGVGYTLSVGIVETASSRELAHAEARAARTEQIPGAIDEVVAALRNQILSRPAKATPAGPAFVPLAREATGSLNALRAYAAGARALAENRPQAALKAYGTAAATDPNFVQALVQISWLAREQGADASSAANRALSASAGRSPRTTQLAAIAAAANTTGDLASAEAAAHRLAAERPHDPDALLASARILRLEGRFSEALASAQQALDTGAQDAELYREAELSLLALDRYDDALTLEDKASSAGVDHPGLALAAAYLAGKRDRVATAVDSFTTAADPESLTLRAAYLDNTGQLASGAAAWREAADATRGQSSLAGAGAGFTARAALDRALAGDCASASLLGRSAANSPAATSASYFNAGVAGALCGDSSLARTSLASLTGAQAHAIQLPALRAATDLGQGNAAAALQELGTIQTHDPSLLTTYLRGLAHLATHDTTSASNELRDLLAHHGEALTGGTNVYPAAQRALARVFAAAGDRAASDQATARFNKLWSSATPAERLRAQTATIGSVPAAAQPAFAEPIAIAPSDRRPAFAQAPDDPRARIRSVSTQPARTQNLGQQKTALTAWPDHPSRTPSYPTERKYQNIRESDLE